MSREIAAGVKLLEKGVLFLGGHRNMTKKLRQQFPKWNYVTDDQLRRCSGINHEPNFLFTYNVSSMNTALRKALDWERKHNA